MLACTEVRSTFFISSALSLLWICLPVQSTVSTRNTSPSSTSPTAGISGCHRLCSGTVCSHGRLLGSTVTIALGVLMSGAMILHKHLHTQPKCSVLASSLPLQLNLVSFQQQGIIAKPAENVCGLWQRNGKARRSYENWRRWSPEPNEYQH